jgi:hypothetical protein
MRIEGWKPHQRIRELLHDPVEPNELWARHEPGLEGNVNHPRSAPVIQVLDAADGG